MKGFHGVPGESPKEVCAGRAKGLGKNAQMNSQKETSCDKEGVPGFV